MTDHKIYVLWSNPIFRDSLQMILKHPEIDWVGSGTKIEDALEEIPALSPDTIIMEVHQGCTVPDILQGLEIMETRLQVISVSMENNLAIRYNRERHSVFHQKELLRIILGSRRAEGGDEG